MTVIREKIYLNLIADTDLRVEYEDDEGTFVRLDDTDRDAFFDAQRCAKVVEGTDSRRLKLRVYESTTPQRKMQKLSISPDALLARNVSNKNVPSRYVPFSKVCVNAGPSTSTIATSVSPESSRPARKQLNFEARSTTSILNNYATPLEKYLKDAERQVSIQTDLVEKAQNNIDQFNSSIPQIEKGSPSCSLCHRRENHDRVNCPYKPYKCKSAFACGDIEKHKR